MSQGQKCLECGRVFDQESQRYFRKLKGGGDELICLDCLLSYHEKYKDFYDRKPLVRPSNLKVCQLCGKEISSWIISSECSWDKENDPQGINAKDKSILYCYECKPEISSDSPPFWDRFYSDRCREDISIERHAEYLAVLLNKSQKDPDVSGELKFYLKRLVFEFRYGIKIFTYLYKYLEEEVESRYAGKVGLREHKRKHKKSIWRLMRGMLRRLRNIKKYRDLTEIESLVFFEIGISMSQVSLREARKFLRGVSSFGARFVILSPVFVKFILVEKEILREMYRKKISERVGKKRPKIVVFVHHGRIRPRANTQKFSCYRPVARSNI